MRADITVIGAGIVGLATANALAARRPGAQIVVVDKEAAVGSHQTGHNSGVIHAGLYYRPDSLKAQLCGAGRRAMVAYCKDRSIPFDRTGKVVVASDETQLGALGELERRAIANGLAAKRIGPDEIRLREPYAAGVGGLWVPETAIVDFGEVTRSFATDASAGGIEIRLGFEVTAASTSGAGVRLESPTGWLDTTFVVNCAGLHVDHIARLLSHEPDVAIMPFRGEYRAIRPDRRHLVNGLIYPVPDPRFPFLGVHATRKLNGDVEIGPNAILATAREGYRASTWDTTDVTRMATWPGAWRLARAHWRTGVEEVRRSTSAQAFLADARRLIPSLTADDLTGFRSGVRAQAVTRDGSLVDDFVIEESPHAVHVLNAPSPAATASLAIGAHIADLVTRRLAP